MLIINCISTFLVAFEHGTFFFFVHTSAHNNLGIYFIYMYIVYICIYILYFTYFHSVREKKHKYSIKRQHGKTRPVFHQHKNNIKIFNIKVKQ